jgi:hypothetical protein
MQKIADGEDWKMPATIEPARSSPRLAVSLLSGVRRSWTLAR